MGEHGRARLYFQGVSEGQTKILGLTEMKNGRKSVTDGSGEETGVKIK